MHKESGKLKWHFNLRAYFSGRIAVSKTANEGSIPSARATAFLAQLVERIHGKDEVSGPNPEEGSIRIAASNSALWNNI